MAFGVFLLSHSFFFSFFFVDRFFLFYFSFFFFQTQVEFFACGLHTKRPRGRVCGGRWKGGGGASGTCLASAAGTAVTATATARPLPDVSLSNRIQQFYDAPSVQQQQRERGGAAQLK